MKHPKYNLERLQSDQLFDLAKFVVAENIKHHTTLTNPLRYENEIKSIFSEELSYFENAQVFVFRDIGKTIIGTIRVLRWNYVDILLIQKVFNIDLSILCEDNYLRPVWHIGRFAIRKGVRDINLFKQLMVCAITPVCYDEKATAYAECDSKLLKTLLALGINAQPIGNPKNYLGSETIPIKMSYRDLIDFYRKNEFLMYEKPLEPNLLKSKNYTFV